MHPLMALAVAALLAASFAGCAEDPERYPDGVSHSSSSRSQTSGRVPPVVITSHSSTMTTGPSNEPPTARLSVAVNGTNATFTVEGSDPDDDTLAWDLDFGDGNSTNGTLLPATVNHTYAGGNFTANLTVTDGQAPTVSSIPVAIGAGGPGGAVALLDETKPWTVSFTGGVEYALGCEADGLDCAYFQLPDGAQGKAFTFTFTATAPAALYYVDLYSDGAYIATYGDPTSSDPIPGGPGPVVFSGVVPDGIDEFRAYATGGAVFTAHLLIP